MRTRTLTGLITALITALVATLSASAMAQSAPQPKAEQDHAAHHPDKPGVTQPLKSAPKPAPKPADATSAATASPMDGMMKSMRAMHEKMRAAQSPEDRQALMAEHMKLMQDGMGMMGQMRSAGGDKGPGMNHHAMHQRMEMMELMMQMLVDREALRPLPR